MTNEHKHDKDCTTCAFFEPLEGSYGHCGCPSSGGCEAIVVEINIGCDMHSDVIKRTESGSSSD